MCCGWKCFQSVFFRDFFIFFTSDPFDEKYRFLCYNFKLRNSIFFTESGTEKNTVPGFLISSIVLKNVNGHLIFEITEQLQLVDYPFDSCLPFIDLFSLFSFVEE